MAGALIDRAWGPGVRSALWYGACESLPGHRGTEPVEERLRPEPGEDLASGVGGAQTSGSAGIVRARQSALRPGFRTKSARDAPPSP